MRIHFIINLSAGRDRPGRVLRAVEKAVRDRRMDCRMAVSMRPGEATELARRAVVEGADAVVAVGGDGTVNEVLNGLDKNTALGIVPSGTCNDIARCLGLAERDFGAALDIIAAGRTARIDAGRCGERRFLSVAGMGLDSRVARAFKRLPQWLRTRPGYVFLIVKQLLGGRPSAFRLELDGETVEQKAWLLAVANMECYGGGMRIAPQAKMNDGRLDVCVVGDASRWDVLWSFPRVWRGAHLTHPAVRTYAAKEIAISCEVPTPIVADGEICGELPARIAVEPESVTVFVR